MNKRIQLYKYRFELLVLPALTAIAFLVGLSATHHLKISPDSVYYVDVSKTLVDEFQLATYNLTLNSAQVPDRALLWPPGYSCVLAIPRICGLNAIQAVRLVAILSILVICFSGYALCATIVDSAPGKVCFLILLAMIANMFIFHYAWSEPPFIAFVMLFLLFCSKHIRDGRLVWLVLAGIAGAMGFLTRYVGVVMVIVGFAAVFQRLLITNETKAPIAALKRLSVFGLTFALVSGPWLLRNMLLMGRPLGPARTPATTALAENAQLVLTTFLADIPWVFAVLLTVMALLFYRYRSSVLALFKNATAHSGAVVLFFAIGYTVLVVLLSCLYSLDPIDSRLLSPIYLPLAVVAAASAHAAIVNMSVGPMKPAYSFLSVAMALAIVLSFLPLSRQQWKTILAVTKDLRTTDLDHWIATNTRPEDLIMGNGTWRQRWTANRMVLASGYPSMPELTETGIVAFLDRQLPAVTSAYLVCTAGDALDQSVEAWPICFRSRKGKVVRLFRATPRE